MALDAIKERLKEKATGKIAEKVMEKIEELIEVNKQMAEELKRIRELLEERK